MTPQKKHDWDSHEVGIKRQGKQIVLPAEPEPMPTKAAIVQLQRKMEDEEKEMEFIETIDAFPLDGAFAFMKAMKALFGWASPVDTPPRSFFDSKKPPKMIGIEVGPNETAQVIFGRFEIPNIKGYFETAAHFTRNGAQFVIGAKLQKRDAHIAKELADLTREFVRNESIYKGKAIHLIMDSDGDLCMDEPPRFIDTSRENPEELVLNDSVLRAVTTSIFTPIAYTDKCREARIPLKRGVLLEGPYGVGKSMIATLTAKHCVENGWTYIFIDRGNNLAQALTFAKRYSPAVVFCEDIDRVTEDRDEPANDLLNTIDGVISKNTEVITVLTSNHVEKINKAMLRPGRLDSVITVQAPNAESVKKLIRVYGRGMVQDDVSLDSVAKELAGQIPATIREVVERAKLYAIPKMNGHLYLYEDDLLAAAHEMKAHIALMNYTKPEPMSPGEAIVRAVQEILDGTEIGYAVDEIKDDTDRIIERLG